MFDFLGDIFQGIWDGVRSIPYLVADLLVGVFNLVVVGIGGILTAVFLVLPGFPEAPDPPTGGILGLLNWIIPLGPVLAGFASIVAAWVVYLGVRVALKWAKAL